MPMCTIMPMFSLQSENSMYQMSCPVCYWYIHIYICQLTESDRRSVNASASAAASDVCVYQILYFNALKPLSWTIVLVSLSVDVYCSHTDLFLLLLELCVLSFIAVHCLHLIFFGFSIRFQIRAHNSHLYKITNKEFCAVHMCVWVLVFCVIYESYVIDLIKLKQKKTSPA